VIIKSPFRWKLLLVRSARLLFHCGPLSRFCGRPRAPIAAGARKSDRASLLSRGEHPFFSPGRFVYLANTATQSSFIQLHCSFRVAAGPLILSKRVLPCALITKCCTIGENHSPRRSEQLHQRSVPQILLLHFPFFGGYSASTSSLQWVPQNSCCLASCPRRLLLFDDSLW